MSDDIYEYVYEMPPFSGEVEIVFEEDGNNPTYKFFKQWEEAVKSSETGPSEVVNINSEQKFLEFFSIQSEEEVRDFVMKKYEDDPTSPIWCERVKD